MRRSLVPVVVACLVASGLSGVAAVGPADVVFRVVVANKQAASSVASGLLGVLDPGDEVHFLWGAQAALILAKSTVGASASRGVFLANEEPEEEEPACTEPGGIAVTAYGDVSFATAGYNWTSNCEAILRGVAPIHDVGYNSDEAQGGWGQRDANSCRDYCTFLYLQTVSCAEACRQDAVAEIWHPYS